jgi:hypothetical protein
MRLLPSAALVLVLASGAYAQAPAPRGVAGGLATRSVYAFQGLERNLEDAMAKGDEKAVKGLVSQGFEFHSGQNGLSINPALRPLRPRPPARILDLTVREFPGVSVVSFTMDFRMKEGGAEPVYSVVDVWSGQTHQLEWRRADEMKEKPPFERKPTGAE